MKDNRRTILGAVIIFIGLVFLLDNLDLGFAFSIPSFLFAWPVVFVAVGVVSLMSGNRQSAVIFLSLAAFFYLQHYDIIDMRTFWPVILIAVGLSFIFRDKRSKVDKPADSDNYFDVVSIFSGSERKITSDALKGGKVTTIFGGAEIDLRQAKAVEGATIEVFCLFGGCEIYVPREWRVLVDTTAILGGFSDSTTFQHTESNVTIRLKGLTMLGGGELRN